MKQGRLLVALAALPMVLGGCDALDIFKADSLEAPHIKLTGRVVNAATGEPIPVRVPGGAQLRVWHTSWDEDDPLRSPTAMNIHMNTDGSFSSLVYDGKYDLQLLADVGPWVNDTTRIALNITGDTHVDVPVQAYYTIANPSIAFVPPAAGDTTGGRITATFRVAQHVANAPPVELVGLYISTTQFVDQQRRETTVRGSWTYPLVSPPEANPTPAGQASGTPHERVRAQVQTQLDNNETITISLILPSNIRLTRSPALRDMLYARVGVKTTGVPERAYSPVVAVNIVP